MKVCTKCRAAKDKADFYDSKDHAEGVHTWCKQCAGEVKFIRIRTLTGKAKKIYDTQVSSSKTRGHTLPEFTKEELVDWLIKQPKYLRLHKEWVESDYSRWLAPSCDRTDDYKPYSLERIEIKTWKENLNKSHFDRVSGVNNKASKTIVQLALDLEFVEEYYSMKEAYRQTNIGHANISEVCNGNRSTAGGFKWMHKEDYEKMKNIRTNQN